MLLGFCSVLSVGVYSQMRKRIRPDFEQNPHLRQLGSEQDCGVFSLDELDRVLRSNAPRKPYHVVSHDQRSVNHWGQRKLLLSEIEFLTLHGEEENSLVVYAGAAPGTHIAFLSELFPHLHFLCVDPGEFKVSPTERITIRQEFFTDEIVEELLREEQRPILFISDIRTGNYKAQSDAQVEKAIRFDQELQKNWVLQLRPKASMLKFRLPWESGTTEYLDGTIYLPVWGRETTTETRLVSVGPDYRLVRYDNKQYEEQLFYFNRVTRVQYYEHACLAKGMDHCFDCASEALILQLYLAKEHGLTGRRLLDEAVEMSLRISRECSPTNQRTLETREQHSQRERWFPPKIIDYERRKVENVQRLTRKRTREQRTVQSEVIEPGSFLDEIIRQIMTRSGLWS